MPESSLDKIVRLSEALSKAGRERMAGQGIALKDGSFPIRNVGDLKNAIQAFGRADENKKSLVKAHIKKRAKALNATNLIPDGW